MHTPQLDDRSNAWYAAPVQRQTAYGLPPLMQNSPSVPPPAPPATPRSVLPPGARRVASASELQSAVRNASVSLIELAEGTYMADTENNYDRFSWLSINRTLTIRAAEGENAILDGGRQRRIMRAVGVRAFASNLQPSRPLSY